MKILISLTISILLVISFIACINWAQRVQTIAIGIVAHREFPVFVGSLSVNGVRSPAGLTHNGWENPVRVISSNSSMVRVSFEPRQGRESVFNAEWAEVLTGKLYSFSGKIRSDLIRYSADGQVGEVVAAFGKNGELVIYTQARPNEGSWPLLERARYCGNAVDEIQIGYWENLDETLEFSRKRIAESAYPNPSGNIKSMCGG